MSHLLSRWIKRRSDGLAKESDRPELSAPDTEANALIEAGIAADNRGDPVAAEHFFRNALAVEPGSARAHMNLGIALQGKGDATAAVSAHREAIALDPAMPHAHYNLGLAFLHMGQPQDAETAFRKAVLLRPGFPEAWVALAEALEALGREGESLEALEAAINLDPAYAGALFNAAVLLRRLGRLDEAETRLRQVPDDHPEHPNAMAALAAVLRDKGRIDQAVAVLRDSAERNPLIRTLESERLFTIGFSDWLSAEALFAEHLWTGCRIESASPLPVDDFANARDPDRVLNIGYLSGDFRGHSVALFTEFLFQRHRRDRVRVHGFSSTPVSDAITSRFASLADVWHDLSGVPDAVAENAIRQERIDILVDLSGHTTSGRPYVLASRPAPVQMTWLGYMGSTGLTRIDYRITDNVADPTGAETLHSEALLRLPHSQWCFRPPDLVKGLGVNRDALTNCFTFGSFNQFAKISGQTVALWTAVLGAVPKSRLLVVGVPRGSASETLAASLERSGIDRKRFELVGRLGLAAYYARYNCVDACLDTTPYSGGTTTCDAFWMGVPVVALAGARSMSRSAASLLASLGRKDLIAESPHEYVAIAARLAAMGTWPASSREDLRRQFRSSPVMDEEGFTADLEALFREAWRKWCSN